MRVKFTATLLSLAASLALTIGTTGPASASTTTTPRPQVTVTVRSCGKFNEYQSGGLPTYRLRITKNTCSRARNFRVRVAAKCIIIPTPIPVERWHYGGWVSRKGQLSTAACDAFGAGTAGYQIEYRRDHGKRWGRAFYGPIWE